MHEEIFRVNVAEDVRLTGFTANGTRSEILPGEHVVHRLRPKAPIKGLAATLRFVGADGAGRDVHVPVSSEANVAAVLELVTLRAH